MTPSQSLAFRLSLIGVTALCTLGWVYQRFEEIPTEQSANKQSGTMVLVQSEMPDPTNHFDFLPAPQFEESEPEWRPINFGWNSVRWIRFYRGRFPLSWNEWEPEHLVLQSSFEPHVMKTNGVWLIQFCRPTREDKKQ